MPVPPCLPSLYLTWSTPCVCSVDSASCDDVDDGPAHHLAHEPVGSRLSPVPPGYHAGAPMLRFNAQASVALPAGALLSGRPSSSIFLICFFSFF
jgi:hypothetical protein